MPGSVLRLAPPLLALLILSWLDRQGVLSSAVPLPGWRPLSHPLLVLLAALCAVGGVRAGLPLTQPPLTRTLGVVQAASAARFVAVALYAIVALAVLSALGVNISGLLGGVALVGLAAALAAQAVLANLIAGLILLLARPYRPNRPLTLRVDGEPYEGAIERVGPIYTVVRTDKQATVLIPNAAVVTAIITLPD